MDSLSIETSQHCQVIDITAQVAAKIPAGFNGAVLLFCPHTTAAITINENADPDVKHDFMAKLETMVPWHEKFYRHAEGNSAAHLKAAMLGFSQLVPVRNGRLELGIWQGVWFCEFDGARSRKLKLAFLPAQQ